MPPYSKRRNRVFDRALPGYNCCLAAPCQIDCRVILRHHCWADRPHTVVTYLGSEHVSVLTQAVTFCGCSEIYLILKPVTLILGRSAFP